MARVIVTPSADADTAEILAYLAAKAGYGVAARYNASFERFYDNLADFPDSGAPRSKIGAEVRVGVISPYSNSHFGEFLWGLELRGSKSEGVEEFVP